ncbi:UNVERIFIED_CONTAM: hypothetical protein Scaly_0467100 [Sesamum calycinum]|uniref:Uncharacterized protein n=1 Tax=Sesamum calycinum TaxID=2727403 RepID=A0AAW2SEX1_9LAMI
MEVYVDEMLVKSRQADYHITELPITFRILRKYQMKSNLTRSTLGDQYGWFLSCMVIEQCIRVNPDKIRAIPEMKPHTNLNEDPKARLAKLYLRTKPSSDELLCLYLSVGQHEVLELHEYDISYKPGTAIKAQTLIEFMTEAMPVEEDEGRGQIDVKEDKMKEYL